MRHRLFMGALAASLSLAAAAHAEGFCEGFQAGWQAAFQNANRMVAMTPVCPMAPMGADNPQAGYQAGLVAGMNYIATHR